MSYDFQLKFLTKLLAFIGINERQLGSCVLKAPVVE